MAKVSVIVPVYNEEQHLRQCMESICNQTLKEIEIICVDDGSTDGSLQILKDYAQKDSRIRVFTQQNQFAGVARNVGMSHATGKYLSFLDSDDFFEPDMLEKMYNKAEEGTHDIVICRYARYYEDSERVELQEWGFVDSFFTQKFQKEEFSGDKLKCAGIFQITNGWAWDKLFRTDFVRDCGHTFSEFRSSEDGFFVYMLLTRAGRIAYMDDVLLTHRVNRLQSLSNTKDKDWQNGFKMLMLIKDEMEKLGSYEIFKQSFLNRAVDFLLWYLGSMNFFEAYRYCYIHIRKEMEPRLGVLTHDREYYFNGDFYDQYKEINLLPLEEHLFCRKKNSLKELAAAREVINRQRETIEKMGRERDWVFPFRLFEKGKTIALYGAGKIGSAFYSQLTDSQFCKDVIWVDKKYADYAAKGMNVQSPDAVFAGRADYIFLAVKNKEAQEEITGGLLERGIHPEQIKCYGE